MEVQQERYLGHQCLRLSSANMELRLAEDFGLRIIGLALTDRENILAHLPEASIEVAGGRDYQLRGGHRLWYGPEVPARTYLPDDRPVATEVGSDYVEQRQPIDQATGIIKSWRINFSPEASKLTINHRLENHGQEPIELAPWAITMLRPGGLGIFPQQVELSDPNGLQPNRHLVLWPYTPVQSDFIEWRDDAVFVRAAMESAALKIGFPNPIGWLAYFLDDVFFVKSSDFDPTSEYIDRGASSQVYCNPDVIELETLGPKVKLQPGNLVEHKEIWELFPAEVCRQDVRSLYSKHFGE